MITPNRLSNRLPCRAVSPLTLAWCCLAILANAAPAHADPLRVLPEGQLPNDARLAKPKDLNGYFPFEDEAGFRLRIVPVECACLARPDRPLPAGGVLIFGRFADSNVFYGRHFFLRLSLRFRLPDTPKEYQFHRSGQRKTAPAGQFLSRIGRMKSYKRSGIY